ncbi:MAG: hypothetical protein IJ048_04080 [Clostridia bacterium]|nr:hypothetical protein [Clostridia bacterium]
MITSNKFMVNSDADRMAAARYATENFAWQVKLDKRDTLRLDLLVEETLGMVKTMLEDFYGQIWFEADDKNCEIHFEATADMNANKKEELLSVSSTGKNAASRGFMAKLGDMISGALRSTGRTLEVYGQETMKYGIVNMPSPILGTADMLPIWTLQTYRNDLDLARADSDNAEEAWDELEKSIVAKLADDIVVGVKGDRIDLVISKKF